MKLFTALLFLSFANSFFAQQFSVKVEARDEGDQELILGAKVHFVDDDRIVLLPSGKGVYASKLRYQHIHVYAPGYEMRELDIDLQRDTILVVYLHHTSLELRETVIEHALISNSERSASVAVTTMNREEMLQNNPSSFAETLESIPGLTTNNVGVGIARPVIRGLAGTRIYVADMGLRQEGQQWGNDHGLELDQYGIERVEVIRGPATIVYGPDAMAGVIHILNDVWPEQNGIKIDLLSGYKTNNNNFHNSLGIKGLRDNFYFNARISQKHYHDMRVPIDSFTYLTFNLPIYDGRLKNTAGLERNASLTLGYKTKASKFWIRGSYYYLKQGLFSGAIGVPNAYGLGHENDFKNIELPSQRVGHFKLDAHHVVRLKKNTIWSTDMGYQRNDRLEQSLAHLHGVVLSFPSDTAHRFVLETYQFRSTLKRTISAKSKLNLGATGLYQQNEHQGFEFLLPNFTTTEFGVYVLLEHVINERGNLNFGLRTDYARVQTEEKRRDVIQLGQILSEELSPASDRTFANWAAQLGFNFEITHHHILKFNLARAYRFPRAVELSMNGVHHGTFRHEIGNPDLTTETAYQFDLLYEYHTEKSLLTITPFVNYYNNFIYLRPTGQFSSLPDAGQMFRYAQHDALLSGAEVMFQQALGKQFLITAKGQYVHAYNISLGRNLPFIPPLELSFEPEWKLNEFRNTRLRAVKKIFVKPMVNYVFAQNFVDINEPTTPGFFLLNADLGFLISPNKSLGAIDLERGIQINLGFRNILNTPYLKHLSRYRLLEITEPGFNFMISARVFVGK
jgi:iron complex outermembrane recepter protein